MSRTAHLTLIRWLAAFLLALVAGLQPASARDLAIVKPVVECASLAQTDVAPEGEAPARIITARLVAAGTIGPYCEVRGYVAPQVRFELRLPTQNWTQRLMFSGCGGFCGRVDMRIRAAEGCAAIENGELALVTSDLGHDTPDGNGDTVWAASNLQGKIDYGYRGVHVVTVAAKAIIERFYGRRQRYAYFNGCSDGGREGLMEVQRYPSDFNGVIAGASVIHDTLNNTISHAWGGQHLVSGDGTRMFAPQDLQLLHDAVLAACDEVGDGVRDGVVGDPAACRFDPAIIRCTGERAGKCLSAEQVEAARALYARPRDPSGRALYFGRPLGSENAWAGPEAMNYAGAFIRYMSAKEPRTFDLKSVRYDAGSLRSFNEMAPIYNATDPAIRAFQKAGGKLIIWHGWADWGVPPMSSVDYHRQVRKAFGGATDSFMRLYMLPGVGHCQGGDGEDKINLLDPMMAWVEDDVAPGAIQATRKAHGRVQATRIVRPYEANGS